MLKLGNIVLDREKHSVTVGKEPVELTYKEYELLKLLMTNAGIVTTRELILDRVWGSILRENPGRWTCISRRCGRN